MKNILDREVTAAGAFPAVEVLGLEAIRDMLRMPGPCITMILPPYRPGAPGAAAAAHIKTGLQEVIRQLRADQYPETALASLLEPLEALAEDPALLAGSHLGHAIFRAPDVFTIFELVYPVPASVTVAGSFAVRSLLGELNRPAVFYILALSKERVDLTRCSGLQTEAVKLPEGVPQTLEEAMAFEPPDHDLENRSSAGVSAGAMQSVRFGTGSGRERRHAHLADFYKLIDKNLHSILQDVPLVLQGVEEDVAVYRNASTYKHLVNEALPGNAGLTQPLELVHRAYAILRKEAAERDAAAWKEAVERVAPDRASADLDLIQKAAVEGRIWKLLVNEEARDPAAEERLNLVVVQTLTHRGEVRSLPAAQMPQGAFALATMRF